MTGILTVLQPAAPRVLLSDVELAELAGTSGLSLARLRDFALAASDIISNECGVAGDGVLPPTLCREQLREVLRPRHPSGLLRLARRFVGEVVVVENGATLDDTAFEIRAGSGFLYRLGGDARVDWPSGRIEVTYHAGFAEVPRPLADVCAEMVARKTGVARDPLMKRERIKVDEVEEVEREFWVDAKNDADITPDMAQKLDPYRTVVI